MDPATIPVPIAATIGGVLVATIAFLWKLYDMRMSNSNDACTERTARLEARVDDLQKKFISRSDADLAKAEERAERDWHRTRELQVTLNDCKTSILRAATIIESVSVVTKDAARLVRIAHEGGMLRKTPLSIAQEETPMENKVIAGQEHA